MVGNLQCLLAVVGLADEEVVNIHTQFLCIEAVERMLCIDERSHTACLLTLGNGMDGQCGLTRRFWAEDFDDTSLGIAAHTQCGVQSNRA